MKSVIYLTLFILTGIIPANAWNWDFDYNKYQNFMPATVVLLDDKGNNYGSPDIEIVAFNGTEIRGVRDKATWDDTNKQYVYYMNVYSNPGEDIKVVFKAFYKATGEPVVLSSGKEVTTGSVGVNPSDKIGDVNAPFQIQPDADPTLKAIRVTEDIQTYAANNTVRAFTLATYPASLTGFTVTYQQNGRTVSPRNAGSYDVIISRRADNTYQAYNRTLPGALVIGLSDPTVVWPTASGAQEGDALSTVTLTGGTGEGTFSWSTAYTFGGSGTYMMEAVFTPTNLGTHHVVKNHLEVKVEATQRTSITIIAQTQTLVYDGTAKAFAFTPSASALSDFTVSYKKDGATVGNATDVGTYDVLISRPQDKDYNAFNQTFRGGLVIEPGTPTDVTWPTTVILDSGKKLSEAVLTGQRGDGLFSWANGNTTPTGTTSFNSELNFIPTNKNYKTIKQNILVTVKVLVDITISTTPQSFPYDGSEKAFVVTPTPASINNFTVTYTQNGKAVTAPANAGSYDVGISRPSDAVYKAFEASLSKALVINPVAYPEEDALLIPWPQDLSLYVGNSLANLTLPSSTIGKFTWKNPAQTLVLGENEAEMIFTPADTNYLTVTKTVTLTVLAAPVNPTYQILIQSSEGGTLLVKKGSENILSGTYIDKNTSLTLQAVPNSDYRLSHYLVNGQQSASNTVIVTGNTTLKAVFVPADPTYQILIQSSEGGTLLVKKGSENIPGGTYVDKNTSLTLQAVPHSDYILSHYLVNGQQSASNTVIVTGNTTLKAVFVPAPSTAIEQVGMGLRYYSESGIVFVSTPVALKLQVVALSGTLVYEKTVNGLEQIGGLQKGIYLLVFTDASGKRSVKKVVL